MLPLSLRPTCVALVDPTGPPVLSLPGAVRSWIGSRTALVAFQALHCLRKSAIRFTGPRMTPRLLARCTQSSGWGSSGPLPTLSAPDHRSGLSRGQTAPPNPTGLGTVPAEAANPGAQHLRQVSGSSSHRLLLNLLSRPLASQLLRGPPAVSYPDETLLRACGLHASLSVPLRPSLVEGCSGCDSTPESIASRCGRGSRHRAA
jgi:hypothetical protein